MIKKEALWFWKRGPMTMLFFPKGIYIDSTANFWQKNHAEIYCNDPKHDTLVAPKEFT